MKISTGCGAHHALGTYRRNTMVQFTPNLWRKWLVSHNELQDNPKVPLGTPRQERRRKP